MSRTFRRNDALLEADVDQLRSLDWAGRFVRRHRGAIVGLAGIGIAAGLLLPPEDSEAPSTAGEPVLVNLDEPGEGLVGARDERKAEDRDEDQIPDGQDPNYKWHTADQLTQVNGENPPHLSEVEVGRHIPDEEVNK